MVTHFECFAVLVDVLHVTSSKHDYANYDQFAPNFGMVYKTIQRIFVPILKLFGPSETELEAKEGGEFSIRLSGKMGWWVNMAAAI